ncbi:MAG: hypothetical protein A2X05_03335 [Bacteroidetes bacterium GWE2_41_25]|nr:MAG: hypothetical protein A2X03_16085 [Bacteroidetes bacterium GWA2_40_15]OFX91811.1 MAG: hypothetical protein A2X05_03335 [Bacteroidetes bacterium GWE2_41_25]OFX94056.1 MAG: hypothetical protein A2X06_14995 [Bacteroidetes bacterium GWC2_40_22]OFY58602.1 MAG: hypothetical protein A2X04_01130 [Bacteroidetes bacterium GWF2_41_9]HBH85534.1 hypothetical protein [Bacteroidales bacterium]
MKKILFLFLTLVTSVTIQAQKETKTDTTRKGSDEIQTLFDKTGHIGWWVSADFAWTKFDGRDAFLGGMSGGIIINHSFSIGLAGYGIMNSQNLKYSGINDTADVYLYGGYGGLKLEYRINPLKKINVAFPLLIGGDGLAYSTWGMDYIHGNHYEDSDYAYAWDSFFIIEPGVVVGVNLFKFMRLDTGISYRFTTGLDLPKTNSNLMNSFNVNISLKFGRF